MDAPDSLTRFATLAAQLGGAFADRTALLAAEGLDEATWATEMERWTARIAADETGDLARRFTAAYTGAPLPLAASMGVNPLAATLEMPPIVPAPPQAPPVSSPPMSAPPVSPPLLHPLSPEGPPVSETQECPIYPAPASVLPFQAAPFSPAPAGPAGKRLHRFDTQTGLPLPAPVWVDIPAPPSPKP